jgi:hypothetical protein
MAESDGGAKIVRVETQHSGLIRGQQVLCVTVGGASYVVCAVSTDEAADGDQPATMLNCDVALLARRLCLCSSSGGAVGSGDVESLRVQLLCVRVPSSVGGVCRGGTDAGRLAEAAVTMTRWPCTSDATGVWLAPSTQGLQVRDL